MRCETCQGSGGKVEGWCICTDCGGSGISHCCDGIQEQRDPGDETAYPQSPIWQMKDLERKMAKAKRPEAWPDRLGEMERDVTGIHSPTPEEEQEGWALAHEAMSAEIMGCADDCCHPSHNHGSEAGEQAALNAMWVDAFEKPKPASWIHITTEPDTHDEWRSLNEREDGPS